MKLKLLFLILILLAAISSFSQIDEFSFDGTHQYANAVASHGNWAVVGNMHQTGEFQGHDYTNAGRVSIYRKANNGNWSHFQDIDEPSYFAYDNNPASPIGLFYGCDVDIYEDHIIVGAYAYDSDMQGNIGPDGMAFIYEYDSNDELWIKVAALAPEIAVLNSFGWSVSISDNWAVVGDPTEEHPINGEVDDRNNIGAAYTYKNNGGAWELHSKLIADNGWGSEQANSIGSGDNFGYDVDIDGTTIAIGAPNRGVEGGTEYGAVYAYEFNGLDWEGEMLIEAATENYSDMGHSVAIYDGKIAAGAPFSNVNGNHSGKIAIFENDAGIWNDAVYTFALDASEGDYFGFDIDMNDEMIAVGAKGFDASKGKVYFYDYNNAMDEAEVQASDMAIGDEFGFAVGLSLDNVVIGAWKTDRNTPNDGTAYFYSMANDVFDGNWIGVVSSDWFDPLNWFDNNIPNSLTDVHIPQAVPNYPEINIATALARNLSIEAGASLTIGTGYLSALGDLNNHGQLINDDILHLTIGGNSLFDGSGQQDIAAGTYLGTFHYDCGENSDMQGDVTIGGMFYHDNIKKLNVGSNILSLGERINGSQRKIIFSQSSSLHLFGERVSSFFMPTNVSQLNNLSIDIPGNEKVYLDSYITINGQLSLLDGDVYLGFSGSCQLTLYNPIIEEEGRLFPHANGGECSLVIEDNGKDDDELYIPADLSLLNSFWVSRTAPTILQANLEIEDLYALFTASFDVNGFEVILQEDADMWIGGDAQINEDMVGGDGVIHEISISSGSPVFDFDVEVDGDFIIGAGAGQVAISAGRCITVNGSTSIGANLILRSDATGSACFIDNGPVEYNSKADANIIVETYIPSKEDWHYIASPIKNATAEFFAGVYLNAYNTAQELWVPFTSLSQDLNTMQGYSAKLPSGFSGQKIEFTGELNTAQSAPLSISLSDDGDAYNLVGNPFPSTIDWDDANWTKTNLANAIYIWNPQTGSYTSYVNGAGVNGGTRYIPAMQGFFVEATGVSPSLQIDNNDIRKVNEATFLKSEEEIENQMRIHLINGNESDEAIIRFIEGASNGFDEAFDARKLFGRNSLPQVFIKNQNGGNQAIQTLNSIKETDLVSLGLKIEEAGEYELFFDMQNSFSEFVHVTLEDKKNKEFISLGNETSFSFYYETESENDRFVLHFKDITSVEEMEELDLNIYHSQNQIYFNNNSEEYFHSVLIYNMAGQVVLSQKMSPESLQSISSGSLSHGSYVFQLISDKKSVRRKILIHQ
ncbi:MULTISPECIES: T9SS type A sorting domain-containing protein [unclassified Lentimicrobium]|uniref:T9SS type A sorting domain-containing protein n=1 Tax=unclassified Lentimicrobium TaxID=2677434 RepID=UPI0015528A53|nr:MULTISPECIES: T9SS type A sorting domain-containing protein [unclassified Lentimicrobium]NPD44047.1 T9SS type A sorting domain-containing protein [Lentimicrobium sp. S6]NPD85899.1 T9SS type A sorting domain-containing protein [Lentimicrobium sp. L6]